MTTVAGITAKAPRLAVWPRREFQAPVPSQRRGPAEQAAALKRSESHYRRVNAVAGLAPDEVVHSRAPGVYTPVPVEVPGQVGLVVLVLIQPPGALAVE